MEEPCRTPGGRSCPPHLVEALARAAPAPGSSRPPRPTAPRPPGGRRLRPADVRRSAQRGPGRRRRSAVDRFQVPRPALERSPRPAAPPQTHRLLAHPGVTPVVGGHVLEVTGQGVETEPAVLVGVPQPDRPAGLEDATVRPSAEAGGAEHASGIVDAHGANVADRRGHPLARISLIAREFSPPRHPDPPAPDGHSPRARPRAPLHLRPDGLESCPHRELPDLPLRGRLAPMAGAQLPAGHPRHEPDRRGRPADPQRHRARPGLAAETAPWIESFFADVDTLGIRRAHHYPRATRYIQEMVTLIERLGRRRASPIAARAASATSGLPASLRTAGSPGSPPPGWWRVSGRVDADDYAKEDARDFALWKSVGPGAIGWDTPPGAAAGPAGTSSARR